MAISRSLAGVVALDGRRQLADARLQAVLGDQDCVGVAGAVYSLHRREWAILHLPTGVAMSVEELSLLHRRYVELSQRFRAAWVFHQFLQSLAKLFFETFDNRYPAEFQRLYAELKDSRRASTPREVAAPGGRFDGSGTPARRADPALLAEDNRVDPALLRQFFHRFRSYDEKILIQLVRFYALLARGRRLASRPPRQDRLPDHPARRGGAGGERPGGGARPPAPAGGVPAA